MNWGTDLPDELAFFGKKASDGEMNQARSPSSWISCSLCLLVAWVGFGQPRVEARFRSDDRPNPYAALLQRFDVSTTPEGVRAYLESLVPNEAHQIRHRAEVARLVSELDNPSFKRRERATRELMARVDISNDDLAPHLDQRMPEVAIRIRQVQKSKADLQADRDAVAIGILKTIAEQEMKGLSEPLLRAIPFFSNRNVLNAAAEAALATVVSDDIELIRKAIDSKEVEVRIIAIPAWAVIEERATVVAKLAEMCRDDSPRIRLTAARELANRGERNSLAVLLALLQEDNVAIRLAAVNILRNLTQQRFGFVAYVADEKRTEAVSQWKEWIESNGQTAKLHFPLEHFKQEVGHYLVLIFGQHQMLELDGDGNILSTVEGLNFPWAVQYLPNGNRLVGSYRGQFVAEFDVSGNEVWRSEKLPGGVFGVHRLPNGNIVVGCHSSQRVIELDHSGEIIWDVKLTGMVMGVQRLENGNTLVALGSGKRVVEVNHAGDVVWEVGGMASPRTAVRLENGNTLVSDSNGGRVIEFNRSGETVWVLEGLKQPYDAQRLENGNTLVSDKLGLRIFDANKKAVWTKKLKGVGRVVRF